MRFVLNMKELIENKIHMGDDCLNSVFFYLNNSIFLSGIKTALPKNEEFFFSQDSYSGKNEKKIKINNFSDVEYLYNTIACSLMTENTYLNNEKIVIELTIEDVNEKFKIFKLLSLIIVLFKTCLHLNNYHNYNYQEVTQKCLDLKSLLILSNKKYSIFQNFKGVFPNKDLSSCPNFIFDRKNKKIKLMIKEIKIEKLLKREKVLMPHLDIISELLNNDFLLNEMKEKANLNILKYILNNEKLESFVKNEKYMIEKINNIKGLFFLDEIEREFSFYMDKFYINNEVNLNEVCYQDVVVALTYMHEINNHPDESVKFIFNTVTNELKFFNKVKNIKIYAINEKDIEILREKYKRKNYNETKKDKFFLNSLKNNEYIF